MGRKKIDLTGQKFGRLLVLGQANLVKGSRLYWDCSCSCGGFSVVRGSHLRGGNTSSCGCYQSECVAKRGRAGATHGQTARNRQLYGIHWKMLNRCNDPDNEAYKWYGGKGIRVCEEWTQPKNFIDWALSNGYVSGLTVDRVDSSLDYCPSNCEWVSRSENTRRRHSKTNEV